MKFRILRASDLWSEKGKPSKNAELVKKQKTVFGDDYIYEIDIRSPEDIMTLVKECGAIVISNGSLGEEATQEFNPCITIWDDYLE